MVSFWSSDFGVLVVLLDLFWCSGGFGGSGDFVSVFQVLVHAS